MIILLDAAPSNDEMLGFFVFFGLIAFVFVVAWLFSPKQKTLGEVLVRQEGEGGSSPMGCLIVGSVIIFVIVYLAMNTGTMPH